MYLLDTDIVIWILRAQPSLVRFLKFLAIEESIGISTMTIGEVYQHILPAEILTTEDFFDRHTVFPVTREIAKQGGLYWQQYHLKLAKLTISDCLVAATAKSQNATLYTLNLRHFPMTDINIGRPPTVKV
ncbi:type II toxin-antitoxin system VapC family toxin [Candidatus Gottesmanbacteria bacterium]|nr:type II toxin-antitoxin system VapC family toxin [Candidatus Gottesmanbacteria bacterium]